MAGGAHGAFLSSPPSVPAHRTPPLWRRRYARHMQPPNFRVLLHNDTVNRSDYVVRVLVKVVDGLTEDTASGIMQVRHSGEEGEGRRSR